MNRFVRYWYQLMIEHDISFVHKRKLSLANKLVLTALMSALTTMFQAAGNLIPGIGLLISPFSTLPIFFAILYSIREGILSYILTIFLLFIIEPSELIVFPFTTGLLGLALGLAFFKIKEENLDCFLFSDLSTYRDYDRSRCFPFSGTWSYCSYNYGHKNYFINIYTELSILLDLCRFLQNNDE